MPQQTSHETLAPGVTLDNGRYKIQEVIGAGGYASVYKAIDLQYGYERAIKEVVAPDEGVAKQFRLEADVLVNIQSPNVPRGYNVFNNKNRIYFVMDFVQGKDLEELLNDSLVQRRRALDEAQTLRWMIEIAGALSQLHTMPTPIIHRDIKPANIKITPQGHPVLIDFGLAKLQEQSKQTQTAAQGVSPGFAPPEQYMAKGRTDARTDIYGLGATLYACLTGKDPAEAPARLLAQTGMNHGAPLEPPSKLNPTISPRTEQLILRALELAPARRQQTARELRDDLRAALSALQGGPALAPTPVAQPEIAPQPVRAAKSAAGAKGGVKGASGKPPAPLARPAATPGGSGVMEAVVAGAAAAATAKTPAAKADPRVAPMAAGPFAPPAAKVAGPFAPPAPTTAKQPMAEPQKRTIVTAQHEAAARASGKHPAIAQQPLVATNSSAHAVLEAANTNARILAAGAAGAAASSGKRQGARANAAGAATPASTASSATRGAMIALGPTPLSPFGKLMLTLAALEALWGAAALALGVIALSHNGSLDGSLLFKLGVGWLIIVAVAALVGGQALARPVLRRGAINGLRRGLQGTALFLFSALVHVVALWGLSIFTGGHGDATPEVIAYTIFGVNVLVAGVLSVYTVLG